MYLFMQDTCSLTYSATGTIGNYALAIQIEDFASPSDTVALSSVPVQFLVQVFASSAACDSGPIFVPPTRTDGSRVTIPLGSTYTDTITAESGGPTLRYII